MVQINLLPEELKPNRYIVRISSKIKKASMLFALVFIVISAIAIGAYLVLNNRFKVANSRQERLKSELQALQQTQQKLVLLQDRIGKIDKVLSELSINEEVLATEAVLAVSRDVADLHEATLTSENATYRMTIDTSSNMTRLFAGLIAEGEYKSIRLEGMTYKPGIGYQIEFITTK